MDITGLPSVKLMKTYLLWKAHKESKLTHLRNFDHFEFLYITEKKNKSLKLNRYKCSLWLPTPQHIYTYFNKYTSIKFNKWQHVTKLRNCLPTKLTEKLLFSRWVKKRWVGWGILMKRGHKIHCDSSKNKK